MKIRGIERHTLMIILIPLMVMVVLLKTHDIYSRFGDMDRSIEDRSRLLIRQLAASCEYAVFSGNAALLRKEIDSVFIRKEVVGVRVLDSNGRLLGSGDGPAAGVPGWLGKVGPAVPEFQDHDMLVMYEPIFATQIDLEDSAFDRSAMPAPADARPLGAVVIRVSKAALNGQKRKVLLFSGMAALLVLFATFLVAVWAARRISRPVVEMTRAVRSIGSGALDTRIPSRYGIDELDGLAEGINHMAGQLKLDQDTWKSRLDEATRELLLKKQEAENASRDKSRFLAVASHDLRQPIHALGLFVAQLRSKTDTPEQISIISRIEQSVEAFSNLLNGLLDISRMDAGIVLPQMQVFSIAGMLNRMAHEFEPVARDKHIKFRVRAASAAVISDPILLERILSNLIGNALRYTPPTGSVLVCCRKRGENLRVEVRDNGIGIPLDDQKHVFREFYQVANQERDRGKGLGLGLAIVDRLSRLLGHSVTLCSSPGHGSVFAIEVRMRQVDAASTDKLSAIVVPAQPSGAHVEKLSADLHGSRVLLVDDDDLVRISTQGMLKEWGCDVSVATSVQEAMARLAHTAFDLLICDYRLPDGNGMQLVDWVEGNCERPVPTVLISGDTALDLLQKFSGSHYHLLHKPVRPARLRSLALFLLEKRDAAPEAGTAAADAGTAEGSGA